MHRPSAGRRLRRRATVALAALVALAPAGPAFAHQGNPDYESLVRGVKPSLPGFSAQVLNGDDRLLVINHSKRTVVLDGYSKEPYLRLAGDGTVSVNTNSSAYYLNNDRDGTAPVPDSVTPNSPVRWKVLDKGSQYEFHDHRIHWMSTTTPKQVTDKGKKTKVLDWNVPMQVAGQTGAIDGTLFWRGKDDSSAPVGAYIGLGAFLLLSAGLVVVVRRRRGPGEETGTVDEAREAW